MKSLYITAFFLLSITAYAQETKKSEQQDQIEHIKQSKEFEAKMMKEAQENAKKKPQITLASEQGLENGKQEQKPQTSANNSGKLLPNTVSFEEMLATIPGRQNRRNRSFKAKKAVNGLPNTATFEEFKKSIPKN